MESSLKSTTMKQESQVILCPYCGHAQKVPADEAVPDQCAECRGLFEPLSRRATQIAMGPWYIRDKGMPFRPGCSYDVIKKQIAAGKIKATTVLRGPTTKQFWSVARNVSGVAHLLGVCHECGAKVSPTDAQCGSCKVKFKEPEQRDALGLQYRTSAEAAAAQKALEKEIAAITGQGAADSAAATAGGAKQPAKPGAGLLDEVLGGGSRLLNFDAQESDAGGSMAGTHVQTIQAGPSPDAAPPPRAAATEAGSQNFAGPAPAAAAPDPQLEELERKNKMVGMITWGLIAFNAILIIVVVLLFVMNKDKPSDSQPQPKDKDAAPADKDSAGSRFDQDDGDDPRLALDDGGSKPAPPGPTDPTPQDAGVDPDPGPVSVEPPIELTPPPVTVDAAQPEQEADRQRFEEMLGVLRIARALFDKDDLPSTLALLRQVKDEYPQKWWPPDLGQRIDEIDREIERRKRAKFFGLPTG